MLYEQTLHLTALAESHRTELSEELAGEKMLAQERADSEAGKSGDSGDLRAALLAAARAGAAVVATAALALAV